MKLKISLFSKSIIKSDFKRFWWVSALYAVILFFSLPLQHMLQVLPLKEEWQKEALLNSLRLTSRLTSTGAPYYSFGRLDIQILFICILPVFLAVMLFSYLHSNRAATMLHSLPLERKTLLGSHTAAGMALILAPVFVIAVIMAMLASFTGLGQYYTILNVVEWAGLTLLYNILFFSIAVFVGMFTGNAIAHIVFTYILNVLPYGLYMLVVYNLEKLLHGFSSYWMDTGWAQVLPLIKLIGFSFKDFTLIQGLLYLLIAFVFLGAAGFAYNARKLEAAGNIIAFRVIQPVFKYGVAVCLMLSAGFITGYNYPGRSAVIAAYFIFAFIGYWVSQMLMEKTVRVWHEYKGFLIFGAAVILLLVGISADVTGYVKRIPALDEVESAYFGDNYNSWLREKNQLPEADIFRTVGFFEEKENIKAVMKLHQALAENKNGENYGPQEYIAYKLKNGRSIVRRYTIDENADRALLKPLYESLEYKEDRFPVLSQNTEDIKLIEIGDRRTAKKPLVLSDRKQVQSFTDIMKKELTDAGYEEVAPSGTVYAYILVTDWKDKKICYSLERSFSALYSWLQDNGYYESVMLVPEEIDHITVQALKTTRYKGGFGIAETGISIDLSDRALIKELFDICSYNMDYSIGSADSGTYLRLGFYLQAGTANSDFEGFIYPGMPMSEALRQELGELGANLGNVEK